MKERPILFSGEMVRAILDGRKSQTRRVVKPEPPSWCEKAGVSVTRLWVQETWLPRAKATDAVYRADFDEIEAAGIGGMYGGWRPSIHMPRWASRITLELIDVRVGRVQEISETDAMREGMDPLPLPERKVCETVLPARMCC